MNVRKAANNQKNWQAYLAFCTSHSLSPNLFGFIKFTKHLSIPEKMQEAIVFIDLLFKHHPTLNEYTEYKNKALRAIQNPARKQKGYIEFKNKEHTAKKRSAKYQMGQMLILLRKLCLLVEFPEIIKPMLQSKEELSEQSSICLLLSSSGPGRQNQAKFMRFLLSAESLEFQDTFGFPPLHLEISSGNVQNIRALLAVGANHDRAVAVQKNNTVNVCSILWQSDNSPTFA